MLFGCALIIFLCALSYFITCGLVYLITLCFGWSFSWLVASGIWLLMILLKNIFTN
jgi:hypothetical protein